MSFAGDIGAWRQKVDRRMRDVFVASTVEVEQSVKEGSAVTGAPGQPVQTGHLKNSYTPAFEGPLTWAVTTNVEYAEPIEEGVGPHGPLTLRSEVGGFHSLKLTRAGWPRIVDHAVRQVVGHD